MLMVQYGMHKETGMLRIGCFNMLQLALHGDYFGIKLFRRDDT